MFLGKRCSPVNLFHIFRTPFPKNTSGGLLCILKLISPTIRIWVIILVVLCFQLIYKILAILIWMRISKCEKCLGIFRDVSKHMGKWETEISFHHLNNEKSFEKFYEWQCFFNCYLATNGHFWVIIEWAASLTRC